MLKSEKMRDLMSLCFISYDLQNQNPKQFYLIPHMMIWVAWKQIYSGFSEQLDFFRLENFMKFVLLSFYLYCSFYQRIFERSNCLTATKRQ